MSNMSGLKYDQGKPDLSIVPVALENAAARALMYGADKYARNNFKNGIKYTRIIAALLRHTKAWNEKEEVDPESGLSHINHMAACVAMLAHYHENPEKYSGFDDRDLHV